MFYAPVESKVLSKKKQNIEIFIQIKQKIRNDKFYG